MRSVCSLRRLLSLCTAILAVALGTIPAAQAQSQPHVFRGATVYPISSAPIEDGVVVIQGGTIQAVGEAGEVDVPAGATEHDAGGNVIMPGLVDTHSHVGRVEGGDRSAAMHPGVRALDAIDVRAPSLMRARAGGITTVNVMPGSGHLMSGQTAYLKLRAVENTGRGVEDLLFCEAKDGERICGGMKMANGTNPMRSGEEAAGPFPGTRAKAAAQVRQLFLDARAHVRKKKAAAGNSDTDAPDRDLGMEALAQVLRGERRVHFHTHRHDDILTALRLRREFGFRLVLHHASEAWKEAERIAEAGVPASIIVLDAPGGKREADEIAYKTGRVLSEAGVEVAYHTDDPITDSRLFLRSAALGVRAGMRRGEALEAMTLAGAEMLGKADRVGSLEAGKDADLIVLGGDPLSTYTKVLQTWVEGQIVFDRSNPEDRPFATGGYRVYEDGAHE
ncbi:MAG: amidohydrolase [Bacteroidetes bacterium QH_8_67_23]|nr:MAG: amidohydrolase [Bacteroidetes bacterium QH_8_67_23]